MYKLIKKPAGKKPEILATFQSKEEAFSSVGFLSQQDLGTLRFEGSVYTDNGQNLYTLVSVPTHAIVRAGIHGSYVEVYTTLDRLPQDFGRAVYGVPATMDDEDVEALLAGGIWNCVLSGDDFLLIELE